MPTVSHETAVIPAQLATKSMAQTDQSSYHPFMQPKVVPDAQTSQPPPVPPKQSAVPTTDRATHNAYAEKSGAHASQTGKEDGRVPNVENTQGRSSSLHINTTTLLDNST